MSFRFGREMGIAGMWAYQMKKLGLKWRGNYTGCFAWEKTTTKIFVHYNRYFLQHPNQGPQFWMLSSEFAGCTGKLQVLHLKKWMCTQDGNPLPPTAAGTWDNKKPAYFCQIFLENEGLSGKSETEHFNSIRCLIRDSWEQQQDKLL